MLSGVAEEDRRRRRASAGERGAADRVRRSHAQTRWTLRLSLAYVASAVVAAAAGTQRWLALHLFLAGAVVLAISGVSLMLTVTWSAAPAPPDRWADVQRTCVALGAAGVAVARAADLGDLVVGVSAGLYLAGLWILAVLLAVGTRHAVERRFDPAVAAYLTALAFGTAGVAVGASMAVGVPSVAARAAHATANVLGLVGIVVGGTMPFFAATLGRSRMSTAAGRARLFTLLAWQATATSVAVVALVVDADSIAALGFAAYALGILVVITTLPKPTARQLRWAGPRLVAIWAGGVWWAVAVGATGIDVAGGGVAWAGRWLLVAVVAGYAQILWGSLAYLLPMLRGGGHVVLSEGFATTRSWPGLAAANLAGLSLALASPPAVTVLAVGVWVVDGAWRAARVGTRRASRDPAR